MRNSSTFQARPTLTSLLPQLVLSSKNAINLLLPEEQERTASWEHAPIREVAVRTTLHIREAIYPLF